MIKDKLNKIISFNGISLIIGIIGGVFGLISPFIEDWNATISLKWLFFVILILSTLVLVLLKLCNDLRTELRQKSPNKIKVIRFISETSTFLIEMNETLGHEAMVSIFYLDDNYEIELGKGYVKNIQQNFIQIQLISLTDNFRKDNQEILEKIENNEITVINRLIVKSYITHQK